MEANTADGGEGATHPKRRAGTAGTGIVVAAALYALGMAGLAWALAQAGEEGRHSEWVVFLGRLHFVVLHLPIGMLAVAFGIEALAMVSRAVRPARAAVPVALWFAALAGVATTTCGYLLSRSGGYAEDLLRNHLWLGIGVVVATFLALFLRKRHEPDGGFWSALGYRSALAGAVALVFTTGHFGGSLTHGRGFLSRDVPTELRPFAARLGLLPPAAPATPPPAPHVTVYSSLIQPVLEKKCWECHGDAKQKGDLRMDTFEALMAGGDTGPSIEPGDAEASELFYRLVTGDEDERMPPDGETPMTAAEILVIRWWIESGAPVDKSLDELAPSDEIRAAATEMTSGGAAQPDKQKRA